MSHNHKRCLGEKIISRGVLFSCEEHLTVLFSESVRKLLEELLGRIPNYVHTRNLDRT